MTAGKPGLVRMNKSSEVLPKNEITIEQPKSPKMPLTVLSPK